MTILGKRIKYLREKRGLSQKQLAQFLGITNVQLSRYESGDRKPEPETITQFASFFEVTTDYLLGISDVPNSNNTNNAKTLADIIREGNLQHPDYELPEDLTEEELDFLVNALKSAVSLLKSNKLKK